MQQQLHLQNVCGAGERKTIERDVERAAATIQWVNDVYCMYIHSKRGNFSREFQAQENKVKLRQVADRLWKTRRPR